MKYKGEKEKLIKAVSTVSRLASTRTTLPILQNIYLEVKDGKLILRATNLEQTIETEVEGEGMENGRVTVPARLITEYLHNNSDQYLTLETNDLTLLISSTNHEASLKGLAAEEYPTIPGITVSSRLMLPAKVISEALSKTAFAAANDESRPVLTGLLWRFKGKSLEVVATDGYRLSYFRSEVPADLTGDYIIPKQSLQELLRLIDGETVELAFGGNQIRFSTGSTTFTSRILEGKFPDYEAILPKKKEFSVKVGSGVFLQSLKLASLFSRDSAFSTKLHLENSVMKITAISPQLGENTNEIQLQDLVAEPFTVSFNAQYFIDALNTLEGDVELEFVDEKSPIVLRRSGDKEGYLYLVMPLRNQ